MEKIKKVLEISSKDVYHQNNLAKEYAIFENGDFLEIGKDCLIFENRYLFKLIRKDIDDKISISLERTDEKYTLCYGISLENVCSLLRRKGFDIICINVIKENDRYPTKYNLTIHHESGYFETYIFLPSYNLKQFEETELGRLLCQLYSNE